MDAPPATAPGQDGGWFLRRAYAGQVPLWKTFWLFFVPTPLLLYGLYIGALWAHLHFFNLARLEMFVLATSLVMFLCISVPAAAVWRCAANTKHRCWGYLAQFVVAAYLLWYGLRTFFLWTVLG
jgi:hypothetical protein